MLSHKTNDIVILFSHRPDDITLLFIAPTTTTFCIDPLRLVVFIAATTNTRFNTSPFHSFHYHYIKKHCSSMTDRMTESNITFQPTRGFVVSIIECTATMVNNNNNNRRYVRKECLISCKVGGKNIDLPVKITASVPMSPPLLLRPVPMSMSTSPPKARSFKHSSAKPKPKEQHQPGSIPPPL